MNKQILTFLSVVAVIAIIAVVVIKVGPGKVATSNEKTAQGLENSGQFDAAMSEYASALIAKTEGKSFPNIPDQNMAANLKRSHLNPQTWQKPIAEIVDWLNVDKKPSSEVSQVLEALARCEQKVIYKNYIFEIKMNKVKLDQYKTIWRQFFCPESSAQTGLIEKAFSQSVVIMTLTGNPIYSYAADFVNRASGRRINASVEFDRPSSFLVKPGSYCLLLKSKTLFKHGFQAEKDWASGTEAVSFAVPDSVNVISAMLRTEVERKKEKSPGGDLMK
jgi:hypothetical protein